MTRAQFTSFAATVALALAAGLPALAEVEVIIPPGSTNLSPLAVPKLPKIAGWTPNPALSLGERSMVLLPDGKTGESAPAAISAQALPKSVAPQITTLDGFVAAFEASERQEDPRRVSTPAQSIVDKAGQTLRVVSFRTEGAQGFTAYGSERAGGVDYWVTFTLSARSVDALNDSVAGFREMLASYQ